MSQIDGIVDTDHDESRARGNPKAQPAGSQMDINTLFYEQGRLRAEMDRLHRDQTQDNRLSTLQRPSTVQETDTAPASQEKQGAPQSQPGEKDTKNEDPPENAKDGKDAQKNDDKPDDKGADKKDEPPKKPLMARVLGWTREHPLGTVSGIAGFILLVIVGVFVWRYLQSYESTDDAQVDGHVNAISSRIAGTVKSVFIENNQNVNRGELVVVLDPRDYDVALEQQKANLSQAKANIQTQSPSIFITEVTQRTTVLNAELDVTTARAAYVAQQQQVQSASADLTQAEANSANATAQELRYHTLVDKEEVSRELYGQKLADARAQVAVVSSRIAAVEVAKKTVDQRSAALAQAVQRLSEAKQNSSRQNEVQQSTADAREAAAQISKAQLDQAILNLSYCKIYAPVGGIIGNKSVEIGATVSVGQELFDVTPIDDLWITANFKETQLRKMHTGQSVRISIDTLGKTFDGYIESMPGATGARYSLLPPDNATGNYVKVVQRLPVRIRLKPNQDGAILLRTGMSVEPKVFLQ